MKTGIVVKQHPSILGQVLHDLIGWLEQRGIKPVLEADIPQGFGPGCPRVDRHEMGGHVELLVVLGGDGTLLSAVKGLDAHPVSVLGVNFGALGFLTETAFPELYDTLEQVLSGNFTTESRMTLESRIIRDETPLESHRVLNDIVVHKSAMARMLDLRVTVDGRFVTIFKADGLILSTPTGSTAYSLSAQGPIIVPTMKAILLTPICPHLLANRPLILPSKVQVQVELRSEMEEGEAFLTLDGQEGYPLQTGDRIEVVRGQHTVQLIKSASSSYFDILRQKLSWGERRTANDGN
jgi:NAD+ kinase